MGKKKEWNYGISVLQFICCLLIVFRHANPLDSFGITEAPTIGLYEIACYHIVQFGTYITDLAVPTFFLISGFLYFSCKIDKESYLGKLKSRLKSIVLPYFIWSTLAFIYFSMLTHMPIISDHMHMEAVSLSPKDIVSGILLSTYAPLWYMRYLFVFVVIGILLEQVLKRKWLLIIVCILSLLYNAAFGYEYFSLIAWIPFFLIGGGIRRYVGVSKESPLWILGIILGIVLLTCAYLFERNQNGSLLYCYRFIISISLFFLFSSQKAHFENKWYQRTGMFIYGAHRPIVSSFNKLLSILIGTSAISALFINWVTAGTVIVGLLLVARLLMNKMPRLWSVINGGR